MFLKDVFNHSRIMFSGIILFVFVFVYINLKWGAVATPVYTPGMFSGKMFRSDTLITYRLFLGEKQVDLASLHFTKRDMITVSITRYLDNQEANLQIINLVKKVPVLRSLVNDSWLNRTTDQVFMEWLNEMVAGNHNENVLSVYSINYTWKNNRLSELNLPKKLF